MGSFLSEIFSLFCPACKRKELWFGMEALAAGRRYDAALAKKGEKVARLIKQNNYLSARMEELLDDQVSEDMFFRNLERFADAEAMVLRHREADQQRIVELEMEIERLKDLLEQADVRGAEQQCPGS